MAHQNKIETALALDSFMASLTTPSHPLKSTIYGDPQM